jgi:signal transduction histidine kinase
MTEFRRQFAWALLIILTVAAVVAAGINFQQQNRFRLPEDGVTWVDRDGRVEALHVAAGSPGAFAGIRDGDVLRQIGGTPVTEASDVARVLVRAGAWSSVKYSLERNGVRFDAAKLVVGEERREPWLYYQYLVALAYLGIGLFVLFRRGTAEKAGHFYLLCLASFVLSAFHYTGKLNNFDKVIYWANVAAGLFAPTLFLHFCLSFPESRSWLRSRWKPTLIYMPAVLLMALFLGAASGSLRSSLPLFEIRWLLDRFWLSFLAAAYLAGGFVAAFRYRRCEDPVARQQLKWLRNGVALGVLPFALCYVAPYALGVIPGPYMKMSVMSLALLPLSWAYAVLRYRLMDVDVIFQQGYAYTLATLCILGLFYGLIFSLFKVDDLSPMAALLLILVAAFAFQPIRVWIQDQLDRNYFYKDRYDYRRTLIEFARELSSQTDQGVMLSSVADRLMRTLSVPRVAFFLAEDGKPGFQLKSVHGAPHRGAWPEKENELDLAFLSAAPAAPYLFFERTRHMLDDESRHLPQSVKRTIAALDLTYYVPCLVQGRTIAYLGVSRTDKGDFLSTEDLELLVTLSGYVGIAIENSRLYESLQHKVAENERLREFNENIVESISLGILAADLDDRVESWNTQMERLTGIPRDKALGQALRDLLPAGLMQHLEEIRAGSGIQHVYKFPVKRLTQVASGGGELIEMPSSQQDSAESDDETVFNIAVAPLISRDDHRIGRLIIFDDVTSRADLERRLMQADKLSSIGLLAAGVAHEVNTPLAVISTYAQMLAKQVADDQQQSALLDKIAKQTFRASEIVNSLLNFSRTSPRQFGEVDLGRVIRDTVMLVEHQLAKAGIRVNLAIQDSLPGIRGDAGQLQQVFLNLFLNARDAIGRDGVLDVSAREEGAGVTVEVSDTGEGIPPEHLLKIYDPFFTTKASRKGTGLGLSISYGIVRDHGGMIEAESRPGEGARFRLEFPAMRKAVNA